MLYRCDAPSGPLCDLLGPRLIARYAIARRVAHEYADMCAEDVTITRIGPTGHTSVACIVRPNIAQRAHV